MAGNRCDFARGVFRRPLLHKNHSKFPKFIRDLQDVIVDEACRAVLSASMYYIDVRVLRIGMPTDLGWQPICWAAVQNLLPWLSRSRFFDAVDELKNVGVLDSTQRLLNPRKKTRSRTTTRGFVIGDKSVSETPSTVVAPSPRMIEMSTIAALIGRGIDGTAAIPMARELIASHGPGAPAVAAAG